MLAGFLEGAHVQVAGDPVQKIEQVEVLGRLEHNNRLVAIEDHAGAPQQTQGLAGLALGAGSTEIYAATKSEPFVVPTYALIAAPAAGLLIGAIAGLYPAMKAARLSPTEALRTA